MGRESRSERTGFGSPLEELADLPAEFFEYAGSFARAENKGNSSEIAVIAQLNLSTDRRLPRIQ
jgi:hypothetical protein